MGSLKAILNKSRKLLSLLLFFSLAAASFSAATFSPNGGNYTYTVGSTVNINISVDGEGELVLTGRTGFLPANLTHSPGTGGVIRPGSEEEDPPPGTINISGVISQWARNASVQFTVQDEEVDAEGDPVAPVTSGSYNFTIVLEITTTSLPNATAGEPYSEMLAARGGGDIRTWSLVSGSLPPGLSLSGDGFITGTPVTSGTSTFTAQVTDGSQSDQRPFSLTVNPPALQSLSKHGRICYIKDVVRNAADGEVLTTGDLYIKDLRTNEERQITNFAGDYPGGALLNPQFTPEGTHLFFTYSPDPGAEDFGVYLIPANTVLTHPDQGKLEDLEPGSKKYAALSPDYTETTGLIVYTLQKTGYTQLWVYDVIAGDSHRIKNDTSLTVRHPCFMDASTIVYAGTISAIQNIYSISATGGLFANLTNNISPTPQYGRILSSIRNPGMPAALMIYSKRTPTLYEEYTDWDVYTRTVTGAEINMTLTENEDEYDPAFFGSGLTSPPIGSTGQMFYAAEISSDNVEIWQANYDRNTVDTNTAVVRRTSGSDTGMVNWGPPFEEAGLVDYVSVQDTRFVYAQSVGGTDQVFRCNYNGVNTLQLTSSDYDKSSPSLARDGGVIAYIIGEEPHPIHRMHYDGTRDTEILRDDNWNLQQASISPDGRWIAYVQQTGVGEHEVRVIDIEGSTLPVTIAAYPVVASPSFNQDMTKIVYAAQSFWGGKWDIYTTDITVDNIAGTVTPLAASTANITNNPNTDDIYPYFSNDGSKVIFVSDIWDGKSQIFTLDIASTKLEMVVANNAQGTDVFTHLMYGPVYDGVAGTDMIAYNMNGQVYRASLYRNISDNPSRGVGTNPVFGITPTGIYPADLKFGWGISRMQGTVVAKRYMPERTAAGVGFEYDIVIDTDETNLPDSYVISEIIPSDFTVNSVVREGGVPVTWYIKPANPATGRQTVEVLFDSFVQPPVSDHILRLNLTAPAGAAPYSVEGKVEYMLNDAPATSVISGNTFVDVAAPFMPVDRYAGSFAGSDGVIGNFDLLYAITCWKQNAQLQGVGPRWPADIGNWDFILLYIIDIWADAVYQGGYEYDSTIPAAADEMYWKPGVWTD